MNKILRQYIKKFVQIYLDDVIIYLNNLKDHKKHIKVMFEKIKKVNFKLKLSKYQQFQIELKFVRHLMKRNDIRSDSQNMKKLKY